MPSFVPPECRHELLLPLRVFRKYLHHEHLSPLLAGRKEVQHFLEILINLQLRAWIPEVSQLIALWQLLRYLCKYF